jgi:hypothetical protein
LREYIGGHHTIRGDIALRTLSSSVEDGLLGTTMESGDYRPILIGCFVLLHATKSERDLQQVVGCFVLKFFERWHPSSSGMAETYMLPDSS